MALSDEWRIKKSSNPAIELANVLTSLKKVIGGISSNAEDVKFGGMSYNVQNKSIVIDHSKALGTYPIDADALDVLVGLSTHEAAHSATDAISLLLFTEHIDHLNRQSRHRNIPKNSENLSLYDFVQLVEEFTCDGYIRRNLKIHSKYLDKARKAYYEEMPDHLYGHLVSILTQKYVYGAILDESKIPKSIFPLWTIMGALANQLAGAEYYRYERLDTYVKTWEMLCKLQAVQNQQEDLKMKLGGEKAGNFEEPRKELSVKDVENIDNKDSKDGGSKDDSEKSSESNGNSKETESGVQKDNSSAETRTGEPGNISLENELIRGANNDDASGNSDLEDGTSESEEDGVEEDTKIPSISFHQHPEKRIASEKIQALFKDVEKALKGDLEDLTEEVAEIYTSVYGNSPALNTIIKSVKDGDLDWEDVPDSKLVKETEWIKNLKNSLGKQILRGEEAGRVDRRRIFRHYTDGKYKKRSTKIKQQDLDVVLLLDASSSMLNNMQIYKASQATSVVLRNMPVYSYGAEGLFSGSTMNLIRLNNDGRWRTPSPNGGTPSGRAIISTALLHPKSLIIHFTDGETNEDISPIKAAEMCAAKFPDIQIANIILKNKTQAKYSRGESWIENLYPNLPNMTSQVIGSVDEYPNALKKALKPWYLTS